MIQKKMMPLLDSVKDITLCIILFRINAKE